MGSGAQHPRPRGTQGRRQPRPHLPSPPRRRSAGAGPGPPVRRQDRALLPAKLRPRPPVCQPRGSPCAAGPGPGRPGPRLPSTRGSLRRGGSGTAAVTFLSHRSHGRPGSVPSAPLALGAHPACVEPRLEAAQLFLQTEAP